MFRRQIDDKIWKAQKQNMKIQMAKTTLKERRNKTKPTNRD